MKTTYNLIYYFIWLILKKKWEKKRKKHGGNFVHSYIFESRKVKNFIIKRKVVSMVRVRRLIIFLKTQEDEKK